MDYSSFGGGTRRPRSRRSPRALGASRRPLLRRTTLAWPSSTRGFLEFTCRPRRRRRRMRLLLVVVAPPRGSSVRVGRSSAALGRGLFRHVPSSWFFYLPARPLRMHCVRVSKLCYQKVPCPPCRVARRDDREKQICAARTTRAKQTEIRPARHRSRNRCTHAAQEFRTRRGKSDATQQWMRQESRCPSSPSAD